MDLTLTIITFILVSDDSLVFDPLLMNFKVRELTNIFQYFILKLKETAWIYVKTTYQYSLMSGKHLVLNQKPQPLIFNFIIKEKNFM